MSPLEIRVIAYSVLALILMGGTAWGVHTLDAHHYERIAQADKLAQDVALQSAQQNVIAAQQAQAAAVQQAEKDHAILVQADTASRDAVIGSVRSLESALHLGGLSAAMANSGKPGGAAAGAAGSDGLTGLVERLNASVERAVAACQHDSTELAGIFKVAPK